MDYYTAGDEKQLLERNLKQTVGVQPANRPPPFDEPVPSYQRASAAALRKLTGKNG